MVGAMLALSALTAMVGWGVPPLLALPLSLLLAMAGCMLLGYGIERIAYRPLRHAPRLAPVLRGTPSTSAYCSGSALLDTYNCSLINTRLARLTKLNSEPS